MPPPPPPLNSPPRLAAAPVPPKKSRGWKILAVILFLLLLVSIAANLTHWTHGLLVTGFEPARSAKPTLEEAVLEDNKSRNKIAVISVDGIISGGVDESGHNLVDIIKDELDLAADDKHVKAVVLKIDSPGGEVLASDEIYNAVADFQSGTNGKPVICSMGSLAASGGYYIASASQWIVANELTITGSIGVIMHGWNYRGLMDKVGLRPETYKSGKFKDMLSPERSPEEIPPEERAMVQGLIDETYKKFKDVVREGRDLAKKSNGKDGRALAHDWEDYADGRVVSGKEALRLGLVDELGNFDKAVDKAMDLAGLGEKESANLIEYQERRDLADLFRMFGKTSVTPAVKIDLGMDLPKLQAGHMYYLWQPFSH